MKQVIVRVDEELHKAVKVKSAETGVSIQAAVELFLQQWAEGKVEVGVQIKPKKSSAVNKPQSSPSEPMKAKPESSSSGSSGFSWRVQSPPEPMKKDSLEADREYYEKLFSQAVEADI